MHESFNLGKPFEHYKLITANGPNIRTVLEVTVEGREHLLRFLRVPKKESLIPVGEGIFVCRKSFSPMRGNIFQYKICYWDLGLRLGMVRAKMKSLCWLTSLLVEGVGKMVKVWEPNLPDFYSLSILVFLLDICAMKGLYASQQHGTISFSKDEEMSPLLSMQKCVLALLS